MNSSKSKHNFTDKLILGTAQMGLDYGINNHKGKISEKESLSILKFAYQNGIKNIDCAESYGDAHKLIGSFHEKNPNLVFNINTKISKTTRNKNIHEIVKEFLKSLNSNQIHSLMFHSFSTYNSNINNFKDIIKLKESGIVKKIGVSAYSNSEIDNIINDDRIDLIQIPFNILDNSIEKIDLIKKAKSKGKIVQARSIFLQGLFFKDPNENYIIVEKLRDELKEIKRISSENNIPIINLALSYVLNQEYIDNVLIGVDSLSQLKQNLTSIDKEINENIVKSIEKIKTKNIDFLNPITWLKY